MLAYIICVLRGARTFPVIAVFHKYLPENFVIRVINLTGTGGRFTMRFCSLCGRRNSTAYTEFSMRGKNFLRVVFGPCQVARPTQIEAYLSHVLLYLISRRIYAFQSPVLSSFSASTGYTIPGNGHLDRSWQDNWRNTSCRLLISFELSKIIQSYILQSCLVRLKQILR